MKALELNSQAELKGLTIFVAGGYWLICLLFYKRVFIWLRHFYASALINEGVDAATVSGALGHSTITTTTSIYCHVFNQAQARAGDAIASVLDFKKRSDDTKGQPEAV